MVIYHQRYFLDKKFRKSISGNLFPLENCSASCKMSSKNAPRALQICATLGITALFFALLVPYFWISLLAVQQLETVHSHQRSKYLGKFITISYHPIPPGELVKGSAIWYNKSRGYYIEKYTSQLLEIVNKEYSNRRDVSYIRCNYTAPFDPNQRADVLPKKKVCRVYDPEILEWGNCTPTGKPLQANELEGPFKLSEEAFGYKAGSPCVLLRPNHVLEWNPIRNSFNETAFMKSEIETENYVKLITQATNKSDELNSYMWILCDGETNEDRELMGILEYYPSNRLGIPKLYFPYKNQRGYLIPFIFVRFVNPVPHVVIRIKCDFFSGEKPPKQETKDGKSAYEQDEEHTHDADKIIRFELLIDDIFQQ